MPEYEPVGKVIHRTDAKVVALPWSYISDNLASESYYKVVFRQPGSHTIVDLMVFVVQEGDKYRLTTTTEVFDVSFPHGKEKRVLSFGHVVEDTVPFDKVSEAETAAKVEAVLHHAHTKDFRPLTARERQTSPNRKAYTGPRLRSHQPKMG